MQMNAVKLAATCRVRPVLGRPTNQEVSESEKDENMVEK
jgi:hypothetical protein